MARRTAALDRAIKKYESKIDAILLRVPAGMRKQISDHASKQGESQNAFIFRAITETIARDAEKAPEP